MPAGREAPAPDHRPCKGGKVQLGGRHTSVPLQRTSRVPRTRPASSSSPCLRRPARERLPPSVTAKRVVGHGIVNRALLALRRRGSVL
jgi:hypothetical protein